MKVKDAAMQAFPFIEPASDNVIKAYHPGMSLRDYVAIKAMQAFIGRPSMAASFTDEELAVACYELADTMLKARK